jgi:hypothetical protein
VTCRRILVVGAPASGKRWLAGRIHALTGIDVVPLAAGATEAAQVLDGRREWIVLSSEAVTAADVVPQADLVVLLATPLWLRDARLVMRRVRALLRRQEHPPLGNLLARTHGWDSAELPAVRVALEPHAPLLASCASSDDVRAVLERILGIPAHW